MSVTSEPLTVDCSADAGELTHTCGAVKKLTSFDGALVPIAFRALTRTKYWPNGTLLALKLVNVLPVAKLPTLLQPLALPASMT